MLLNKKIIFRYQNFKNKYIKNKSQIGKGNYDANNPNNEFDILNSDEEQYVEGDEDLLVLDPKNEFDVEIIDDQTEIFYIDDNDQIHRYHLKILSVLEKGTFPKTQFPQRMIFCEDAKHDIGAIGANLLEKLPVEIINDKLKEKGKPSSLDAIIKIENINYNSNYLDGNFEIIEKFNFISDHNGIVLKLNKLINENAEIILENKITDQEKEKLEGLAAKEKQQEEEKEEEKLPKYINIISFNLEGLCRQNFTDKKTNKIVFDELFEKRLELLDIHLRKYIDRYQSFILVCQEIVLKDKVNNQNHFDFLINSCERICEKLKEISNNNNITFKEDGFTSGIFYSTDISIDDEISIERFEKSDDKINDSSKGVSSISSSSSSSSSSYKTNVIPLKNKISLNYGDKKKDYVSSNSNDKLKKKSNAYLINKDFWIVNIHLKASATMYQHIEELRNIIDSVFVNNKNIFKNVYLIGDFNHNNIERDTTENLVNSAILQSEILKTEQIENPY